MIPAQRKLVKDRANRPFVLIGVNSDKEDRSVLARKFKKDGITWPQVMDGGESKIAGTWNIRWYPSIFVIDHKGVIRHRDVMEHELEAVLDELISNAERDQAKPPK